MGVPALFRWLSKKYPRIIYPVIEEEEEKVETTDGVVTVPVNMALPNPNKAEFDNLYLDMNGIVHPCTHPEGRPAPETEEEMMVEIFKYTERVVNMVRPRKLLFMAIDGVAPRAKMNQQRSRRFRAAQEAKEKDEARKESILLWEGMGKTISDDNQFKESWDSNAITPGTPFMDLLAASLRYWTVHKMNTDSGWKNIQVIISDASVPGEGEHKIMDFIRRQRTNPGHDPNTEHVIYGLDADLIMLALATHEPHFRVLREDVFSDSKATACRICGQEGHYAAECTAQPADIKKPSTEEKKPFIFLDVAILREYLEIELEVTQMLFPFNLEQAIDDWVLLIFFVGNDFLPHLPSLEIREGGIDTLLNIWKRELPSMGGYMTQHGILELSRLQIILSGLAQREDDIFRRRREAEERQEQNAKRRKVDIGTGNNGSMTRPSSALALDTPPTAPRPAQHFAAKADSIGLGATPTSESAENMPAATSAFAGSNHDIVANRRAIRMANMSAAEVLKAELAGGLAPVKQTSSISKPTPTILDVSSISSSSMTVGSQSDLGEIAGSGDLSTDSVSKIDDIVMDGAAVSSQDSESVDVGVKRKLGEAVEDEDPEGDEALPDEDDAPATEAIVKPSGEVEVVAKDEVRLWETGYKERYYKSKFGVEYSDQEFRRSLVKSYVEGLCWVLRYYYQGTPSWQWFYPSHFAPFAADFESIDTLDINFELGQPFKPFEQLMGVFPAASRKHIPEPFHTLMVDEESPIIDFYPETFKIDMNGKKMAWQGIALLPFIDQDRLLNAMGEHYPKLTEDEQRRNKWGDNIIFAVEDHSIYPFYEQLYGKRKSKEPVPLNTQLSKGISGSVLPDPECLPGSTYYCPLTTQNLPDITHDRSLSMIYLFPKQLRPHRSEILPGTRRPPRVLSAEDLENARRHGRGRGRGDRGGYRGTDRRNDPFHSRTNNYPPRNDRGYNGRGGPYQGQQSYPRGTPPSQNYGGNSRPPPQNYDGYNNSPRGRGPPPPHRSYNSYGDRNGQSYAPPQQNYGGYGGYGAPPPPPNYGGYGQPSYGGDGSYGYDSYRNNASRGRGRGW